jgi:hypothetical protein
MRDQAAIAADIGTEILFNDTSSSSDDFLMY